MTKTPQISVIMSVFNSEQYLKEAIGSILNQSFADFEFIITDDSSTDNSIRILEDYKKTDERIILLRNSENLGLTKNLNIMLRYARGKYIARMDADDISLPLRFEKQFNFLEANPDIGILGAHSKMFGDQVKTHIVESPLFHEDIRTALLFENIIVHSTIIFRNSMLSNLNLRYDESFRIIQDFELWSRSIDITKFAILPEVLVMYRVSDSNLCAISSKKKHYRENYLKNIYSRYLKKNKFNIVENQICSHILIIHSTKNRDMQNLHDAETWLKYLKNENDILESFNPKLLNKYISKYWFAICTKSSSLGIIVIIKYFRFPFRKYYNPPLNLYFRFILKCFVKY